MELLVVAAGLEGVGLVFATEAGGAAAGLQINFFWIIVSSLNFLLFLFILWTLALKPVSRMLNARRVRIEEGLRDAEQARRDRDSAQQEHIAALAEARREANDILTRAQRVAQETETPTWQPRVKSLSGCASERPTRSKRRSCARWRSCAARSLTSHLRPPAR